MADDVEVDGLEAVEGGVLEDALALEVVREDVAGGVEEVLGLDDDDLGEVVAADTGGEEARYATRGFAR